MNRHFPKEDAQMASKYRKRHSISSVARETKIKTRDTTPYPQKGHNNL